MTSALFDPLIVSASVPYSEQTDIDYLYHLNESTPWCLAVLILPISQRIEHQIGLQ
jgi:hypothetical protein